MTRSRVLILLAVAASLTVAVAFQAAQKAAAPSDPLLAGFHRSTVASVSDAVDQITGKRGFMSFDMRPYIPGKIVGRANTALVRPAPPEKATPAAAVKHSVEMIEGSQPGEVGVIVMEGSRDVAAIGGLMGTAAKSRGMAGMILEGAVRDLAELRALNLPVYARGVSPATAVSRYATVDKNIAVECGGVTVNPGDIIVAGEDGVVVVPKAREQEVLKRAQEIDDRETKMVPFIKKFRSLSKAIEVFNRI